MKRLRFVLALILVTCLYIACQRLDVKVKATIPVQAVSTNEASPIPVKPTSTPMVSPSSEEQVKIQPSDTRKTGSLTFKLGDPTQTDKFFLTLTSQDPSIGFSKQVELDFFQQSTFTIHEIPTGIFIIVKGEGIRPSCTCEQRSDKKQLEWPVRLIEQFVVSGSDGQNVITLNSNLSTVSCPKIGPAECLLPLPPAGYLTNIKGTVFDEQGQKLDGATVQVKALDKSSPFVYEELTKVGAYLVTGVPSDTPLEVLVKKSGYVTRRQVVLLDPNRFDKPDLNRFNFGFEQEKPVFKGRASNAISNLPEVIKVAPEVGQRTIESRIGFRFNFSEAMETTSVESSFVIRTSKEGQDLEDFSGKVVATSADFDVSWSDDKQEVFFKFKEGKQLSLNGETEQMFQVSFNQTPESTIQDIDKHARQKLFFRLNPETSQSSYIFTLYQDSEGLKNQ